MRALAAGEKAAGESARFPTLGCWSATAAEPLQAATFSGVVAETLTAKSSERCGRCGDAGSLENQKRHGYF